jgi:hypothetical protein
LVVVLASFRAAVVPRLPLPLLLKLLPVLKLLPFLLFPPPLAVLLHPRLPPPLPVLALLFRPLLRL